MEQQQDSTVVQMIRDVPLWPQGKVDSFESSNGHSGNRMKSLHRAVNDNETSAFKIPGCYSK